MSPKRAGEKIELETFAFATSEQSKILDTAAHVSKIAPLTLRFKHEKL